jgi:hypothetical protein
VIKKVPLLKQWKGGDGRYRPGLANGAIDVDRIVYLESVETWQDKSVTCVHFDDGTMLDVVLSIKEIMDLQVQE